MITLNPEQEEAFNLVRDGKSICLTGKAGSGKTYVINHIIRELGIQDGVTRFTHVETDGRRRIAVTGMTGIASTYINGITLHSWAGIPVRQTGKAQILKGLLSANSTGKKDGDKTEESEEAQVIRRWTETDLLIIDEVSMMSAEILNKLDYLGRHIRNIDKPLGGLQLVLSGDFCQLPPIGTNERYCFESQVWAEAITKTFALKQIIRQSDLNLQTLLNEVRQGNITMKGKELLNSRLISNLSPVELALITDDDTTDTDKSLGGNRAAKVKPTLIYPHRERVNDINRQKFERLVALSDNKVYTFTYADTMSLKQAFKGKIRPDIPEKELEEFIDQHCTAEKDLYLCVGCQVMLTVNLDLNAGLVNGLTGIITGFEDGLPILSVPIGPSTGATGSGTGAGMGAAGTGVGAGAGPTKSVKIDKWTWAPDHPRYLLKRVQIPLILAWAITVHRSQGATLSSVRADLKEAFGPGMAYVILSRIKALSGLYLEGINYSKIKCDPRVLAFYKGLR